MAKDFITGGDVSPDVGSDSGNDVERSDFGGDLASGNGVDLNAGQASKAIAYDVPPPPLPVPSEIRVMEGHGHAGKTPEQIATEMAEAWDYAGPPNESE